MAAPESDPEAQARLRMFRDTLQKLGWAEAAMSSSFTDRYGRRPYANPCSRTDRRSAGRDGRQRAGHGRVEGERSLSGGGAGGGGGGALVITAPADPPGSPAGYPAARLPPSRSSFACGRALP